MLPGHSQLNDLRHMSQAWFPIMLTLRLFQEGCRWELSGAVPVFVREVELRRAGRCPEVSAVTACTYGSLWRRACPGWGRLTWAAAVPWPPTLCFQKHYWWWHHSRNPSVNQVLSFRSEDSFQNRHSLLLVLGPLSVSLTSALQQFFHFFFLLVSFFWHFAFVVKLMSL